jgi:uncharacterized protein (TIGR02594 family)
MTTRELQQALFARGFDPGPIDGVMGRRTIAAIKAFQAQAGLVVDGIAGPVTRAALGNAGGSTPDPLRDIATPWLIEAQRAIGITEDTSAASNPLIIGWAQRLRIDYGNDDIPWCGLFVAHCIGLSLPEEPLPATPLLARSWNRFGVDCAVPQPGAVMTFWRGKPDGWNGHVGFYVGEDAAAYHILGGNQGNQVNVRRFPRGRFLAARWPRTALPPDFGPRRVAANGQFSTGEA